MNIFEKENFNQGCLAYVPTQSPKTSIEPEMSSFDILLGKEKVIFNHIGNRNFRSIINANLDKYIAAPTKSSKSKLIRQIHAEMTESGYRFLRRNELLVSWEQIEQHEAREKVSHALRDRVRELQKPTLKRRTKDSANSKLTLNVSSSNTANSVTLNEEKILTPKALKSDVVSVNINDSVGDNNNMNRLSSPTSVITIKHFTEFDHFEDEKIQKSKSAQVSNSLKPKRMSLNIPTICHDDFEPVSRNMFKEDVFCEDDCKIFKPFSHPLKWLSNPEICCTPQKSERRKSLRNTPMDLVKPHPQRRLSLFSLDDNYSVLSYGSLPSHKESLYAPLKAPRRCSILRSRDGWAAPQRRCSLFSIDDASYRSSWTPIDANEENYDRYEVPLKSHDYDFNCNEIYNAPRRFSLSTIGSVSFPRTSRRLSMSSQEGEYYITIQPEIHPIDGTARSTCVKTQHRLSLSTIEDGEFSAVTRRFSMCSVDTIESTIFYDEPQSQNDETKLNFTNYQEDHCHRRSHRSVIEEFSLSDAHRQFPLSMKMDNTFVHYPDEIHQDDADECSYYSRMMQEIGDFNLSRLVEITCSSNS
jgi:hypothetical protein